MLNASKSCPILIKDLEYSYGKNYKKKKIDICSDYIPFLNPFLNSFIKSFNSLWGDGKRDWGDRKWDLSGDLTNNGEKKSHQKLANLLGEIERSGKTKVLVIPGNHDIDNPWARSFEGDKQVLADSVSPKEFTKIYGDFGYKEAISRDKKTLSYLATP